MPKHIYDVIVIGVGGLYGSSAFYHSAKIASQISSETEPLFKLPRVLGIEQFKINHTLGSSHGDSRITRVATGEGSEYVQIAQRSHELWREIEKETANKYGQLCHLTGGLIISSERTLGNYHGSKNGFLQQTRACAREFKIPHQNLPAAELRKIFPQFKVEDHESGYYETKSMGYIRPDACIQAQIALAVRHGAELHNGETLLDFEQYPNGSLKIVTRDSAGKINEYQTKKLILTAGSWTPGLLKEKHPTELKVYRQTLYWFEVTEEARERYAVGKFPPFIWDGGEKKGIVYGFPIMEGNFLKIGSEKFLSTTTPETVDRSVSEDEVTEMYERFVKPNFVGISAKCHKKATCLYTVAPGHRFVIDYLPDFDNKVIVVSACSGHGAKHSAAIGEAVAQLSLREKADIDVVELFGGLRPASPTLRAKL